MIENTERGWFPARICLSTLWPCEPCEDLVVEAWERMTYGGIVARYDPIIPFNFYTEIDGKAVSYPNASC